MWGPGQSVGNSQAPNENVKLGDLNTATAFYKQLMERFCL
jgi:acetylornithine deacetylase/succinyl-diaminopimelate desuccinylase-like protein